jgi:putative transcriptional regulator
MRPGRHPKAETLVAFAAGTLHKKAISVIAYHVSQCAECAEEVRWLEVLGGVMLCQLQVDDAEAFLPKRVFHRAR